MKKALFLIALIVLASSCSHKNDSLKKIVTGKYISTEIDTNADSTSMSKLQIVHSFNPNGESIHNGSYTIRYTSPVEHFSFSAEYKFSYIGTWSVCDSVLTEEINPNDFKYEESSWQSTDAEHDSDMQSLMHEVIIPQIRGFAIEGGPFIICQISDSTMLLQLSSGEIIEYKRY